MTALTQEQRDLLLSKYMSRILFDQSFEMAVALREKGLVKTADDTILLGIEALMSAAFIAADAAGQTKEQTMVAFGDIWDRWSELKRLGDPSL